MIGDNIRKIRNSQGLSLNALARKAKVSTGYLSELENNISKNPTMDKLNKIADALGVTVEEFFKEDDTDISNNSVQNVVNEEFDDEIRAIARDMKNLSQPKRKLLKDLIKTMSDEGDEALKK